MAADDTNPVVLIPNLGAVRGELDKQVPVVRYLGIPFATVNKRWNPATPIQPWEGVRDATKVGFSPPQPNKLSPLMEMLGGVKEQPYEEVLNERDCLNVNIFVPHDPVLDSDEPLPVMVWVYGGALRSGGNYAPLYDCTNFVAASIERKKPVVMVCINYRVNYFGFLASKELKEDIENDPTLTGEQKAVGNWGFQDQKLAFLWVRDHIAAFRGNKDDITAFGESAGSISLTYHMTMPAHHGLFHKAILQSGVLLSIPTQDIENQGQLHFDGLCDRLGIPKETPAKEKMARLRATPERTIADIVSVSRAFFHPTVDGVLIDSPVQNWFDNPARLDPGVKKVLIGMNRDEGTIFAGMGALAPALWPQFRARLGSAEADLVLFDQMYGHPGEDVRKLTFTNARIMNDIIFQAPILSFVSTLLKGGHVETSVYFFDCTSTRLESKMPGLGASHAMDLLYLFDSAPGRMILTEEEHKFGRELRNVWLEFATTASKDVVPIVRQLDSADEKNIIVFQRDFKVGRSDVNWITKETLGYWLRFFDYQRRRIAEGDYDSHGIKYIGPAE